LLNVKDFKEKYNQEFITKEVIPQIFLGIALASAPYLSLRSETAKYLFP
jgi:hypothetical protein